VRSRGPARRLSVLPDGTLKMPLPARTRPPDTEVRPPITRRAPGAEPGQPRDDAVFLSPAYLASLQKRRQSAQRADLRRSGRRDGFPLRLPTTRAEVNGGDMPEGVVAVVDAWPNDPARHLRQSVVDGRPCVLPHFVCHRPRLRSRARQTTNAAISMVNAMVASDHRRRRRFTSAPLIRTGTDASCQPQRRRGSAAARVPTPQESGHDPDATGSPTRPRR